MKAIKDNRVYRIESSQVKSYAKAGYDVYDDDGEIVAYAANKTVPFEKYMKLMQRVEAQADQIKALEDEIKALKKKGK